MKRDIFEDFPEREGREQGEPYESGREFADTGLAELILEHYRHEDNGFPYDFTHHGETYLFATVKCLSSLIETYDGEIPEPNILLDQVVMLIYEDAIPSHLQRAGNLFTGLVQTLYGLGHNYFVLDLSPLIALKAVDYRLGFQFGVKMHGTEDDPLHLTLKGSFSQLFGRSKHVKVNMVGSVIEAAEEAEYSEFTLKGKHGFVGGYAVDCDFYVEHAGCVQRTGANNSYHVIEPVEEQTVMRLKKPVDIILKKNFWGHNNTLYQLDDKGEWKEVEP